MRIGKLASLLVLALALAAVTGMAFAAPYPIAMQGQQQPAPQTQTATGKITAVSASSFTLEIQQGNDPSSMQFTVDKNTQVDGKLKVGATATVEYRTEGDKNIAVHVVVS